MRVAYYMIILAMAVTGGMAFAGQLCPSLLPAANLIERRLHENDFEIMRSWKRYELEFANNGTPSLSEIVESLPQGAHYIDMGAGTAYAVRSLLKEAKYKSLNIHALGFKKPANQELESDLAKYGDRFRYLEGLFDKSMAEELSESMDFLTDLYGPLSYSHDLAGILNLYAEVLKPGGRALVKLYEGRTYFEVRTPSGSTYNMTLRELSDLIPRLTGGRLQVVEARMGITESKVLDFAQTVFYLEKTLGPYSLRENLLTLREFQDAPPPLRIYQVAWPEDVPLSLVERREADLERERKYQKKIYVPSVFRLMK